jgi:hypothetical protein
MTENLPAQRDEVAPVKVDLSQPLTDLDQAMRLANALSRSELVPESLYGKAASVLHVLLTGQAMDLHWSEAIRVIYSPGKGQIGLRGQFLLTRLRVKGHSYRFEDGDGWATFILTRGDDHQEFRATFTHADAEQAGLISRTNWKQYEKRMLRWRAVAECVSFGAPDVLLGFEVEGAEEAPGASGVVLRPESPAPPEPGDGKAAPGDGQAAQAEQLRKLDERIATHKVRYTVPEASLIEALEDPESGGESAVQVTVDDPHVGGMSGSGGESAPSATPEAEAVAPEQNPPPLVDEPVDAAVKATTKDLAGWFREFGYDPKQYRPQVLNACSVYVRRNITGVRDLKLFEVADLCKALSVLWDASQASELAPVSMLAEKISEWAQAWEREDPDGYALYAGPQ